jgi:hypothetical protein
MANEIYTTWPEGATLYAIIRELLTGNVYNNVSGAFEAWSDGSIGSYDIPLTDYDGNHYSATFPATIPEGLYKVDIFLQAGGSPADGDWSPSSGFMNWDGQQERSASLLSDQLEDIEDAISTLTKTQSVVKTEIVPLTEIDQKSRIYI